MTKEGGAGRPEGRRGEKHRTARCADKNRPSVPLRCRSPNRFGPKASAKNNPKEALSHMDQAIAQVNGAMTQIRHFIEGGLLLPNP